MGDIATQLRQEASATEELHPGDSEITVMREAADELERLQNAISHYAMHQPLDGLTAHQIQADLLSIAGEPHMHRRSIGDDRCLICGHDLRHDVHLRTPKRDSQ